MQEIDYSILWYNIYFINVELPNLEPQPQWISYRERGRERERERQTDRQTYREREREIESKRDRDSKA